MEGRFERHQRYGQTTTQCCTRDENSRRGSRSRENRAVSKCLAGLVAVSTILDRSRRSRECSVVSPKFRLLWCRRCCLGRRSSGPQGSAGRGPGMLEQ
jgi:hypothetical protein